MKKLILILTALSLLSLTYCQDEIMEYEDLTERTTPLSTDGFTIYRSGVPERITKGNLFASTVSSINTLLDDVDSIVFVNGSVIKTSGSFIKIDGEGVLFDDTVIKGFWSPSDGLLQLFIGGSSVINYEEDHVLFFQPIQIGSDDMTISQNEDTLEVASNGKIRFTDEDGEYFIEDLEGGGGGTYYASGGITIDEGDTIRIDGTLNDEMEIDNSSQHFYIKASDDGSNNKSTRFSQDAIGIGLTGYPLANYSSANGQFTIYANHSAASMYYYNPGPLTSMISVSDTGIYVKDEIFKKGLYGAEYYGDSADDNTYVQKKYVDSVASSTGAHLLADTLSAAVGNIGLGNAGDSANFEAGIFLGGWRQYQDSAHFCRLDVKIWGEVGDSIGITGYWNEHSADSTGTISFIDFDIGTNGSTSYRTYYTTFDTETVPPGEIYFKMDALHGNRPKMLRMTLGYTEIRR